MSYNPWRDLLVRYPDVHVELHPIAPARAFWAPQLGVIIIDTSIGKVERRCALAHEIAHMDVGDRPTDECWFATRQENAADKLAARRLIDVADMAAVLRYSRDPRELADELDVTMTVLEVRRGALHPSERGFLRTVLGACEVAA